MSIRGFAWFPHNIHPYESQWLLVHKFALWNSLGIKALQRAISSSKSSCINLITGQLIDVEKFNAATGLSRKSIGYAFIDAYLPYRCRSAVFKTLRFCPHCLVNGYHSNIHQLEFFTKCPLHDVELVHSCFNCGALISADTAGKGFNEYLKCHSCNYHILEDATSSVTTQCIENKTKLSLEVVQMESIKTVMEEGDITCDFNPLMDSGRYELILEVLKACCLGIDVRGMTFEAHKVKPSLLRFWPIYKCVRRSIYAHSVKPHGRCLRSMQRLGRAYAGYGCPIPVGCPTVHAYMMWRMYWESSQCFSGLHLDTSKADLNWKVLPGLTLRQAPTVFAHQCIKSFSVFLGYALNIDREGRFKILSHRELSDLVNQHTGWMLIKDDSDFVTIKCWELTTRQFDQTASRNAHCSSVQLAVENILASLRTARQGCHKHSCKKGECKDIASKTS